MEHNKPFQLCHNPHDSKAKVIPGVSGSESGHHGVKTMYDSTSAEHTARESGG